MLSYIFFTSEKVLGSGMKWETSEPDSSKGVISCKISFKTVENTLCIPLPILHVPFNAPFHSDCICLIRLFVHYVVMLLYILLFSEVYDAKPFVKKTSMS